MYSQSILKISTLTLVVTFALLLTTVAKTSAQEIFGGRGISGEVLGNTPSFSNPLGAQFDTQTENPIGGLFKKPAFLENLKIPTIEFKKPSLDLFNSAGNNQSPGSGFLSNLPKLGNLFPQREPGQQSLLGKMKTKTDAFFAKAFAFEKLFPGRAQTVRDDPEWDSLKQSMEQIMAQQATESPERTAAVPSGTLQR